MLFLLFRLGKDRYAIEARQVVEVLPMLAAKQIPHAPPAVRGAYSRLLASDGVLPYAFVVSSD